MARLPVNNRHDFRTSGFNPRRRNDPYNPQNYGIAGCWGNIPITVRREKALVHSGMKTRPGTGSLHPVAIGAAVEATKPPEPPV